MSFLPYRLNRSRSGRFILSEDSQKNAMPGCKVPIVVVSDGVGFWPADWVTLEYETAWMPDGANGYLSGGVTSGTVFVRADLTNWTLVNPYIPYLNWAPGEGSVVQNLLGSYGGPSHVGLPSGAYATGDDVYPEMAPVEVSFSDGLGGTNTMLEFPTIGGPIGQLSASHNSGFYLRPGLWDVTWSMTFLGGWGVTLGTRGSFWPGGYGMTSPEHTWEGLKLRMWGSPMVNAAGYGNGLMPWGLPGVLNSGPPDGAWLPPGPTQAITMVGGNAPGTFSAAGMLDLSSFGCYPTIRLELPEGRLQWEVAIDPKTGDFTPLGVLPNGQFTSIAMTALVTEHPNFRIPLARMSLTARRRR
jgi:hypothetical protein